MNLVKTHAELTDYSLLVLCDLATNPSTERRFERIRNLLTGHSGVHTNGIPGPITALERAQLVEVRRIYDQPLSKSPRIKTWTLSITDRGITLHRSLMTALHNATA
jgi:hypothetical protein